jgi:hypothetical protein
MPQFSGIITYWAASLEIESNLMLTETHLHTYEYECSLLKGTASVETFAYTSAGAIITPETADPHIPFGTTSYRMTCRNRDECGIRRGDTNGESTYAWSLCPAYQTLSETHSLPIIMRNSSGLE